MDMCFSGKPKAMIETPNFLLSERYETTSPFRQVLFAFHFVGKTLNKLWLFAVFPPCEKQK